MRNLRVTTLVAGALVGGLLLGGIGIATAATRGSETPAIQTRRGAVYATSSTALQSGDTTQPATPPTGDTTPSVSPTRTPRPPMPPQSNGHAYGRMMAHPHRGLHLGRVGVSHVGPMRGAQRRNATSPWATGISRGNSGHMGGSMMGH
jgi:hypothetical protein